MGAIFLLPVRPASGWIMRVPKPHLLLVGESNGQGRCGLLVHFLPVAIAI